MSFSKIKSSRWTYICVIVIVNIVAWATPSNLNKLITKGRPIMLGCYSVEKLTFLFAFALLSASIVYALLPQDPKKRKFRFFQIIAFYMFLFPSLIALEIGIRVTREPRYVLTEEVFHRLPNKKFTLNIVDKPKGDVGYFREVAVYESYQCSLTSDKNGFRNRIVPEVADIVTIGDSFTEGTDVDDNDIWPKLVANKSGKSLYNIGVSGTDPLDYFMTFERFGVAKKPKTVICMIYEGNDFRADGRPEDRMRNKKEGTLSFSQQIRALKKSSPLISTMRSKMEEWFETKQIAQKQSTAQTTSKAKENATETKANAATGSNATPNDFSNWLPVAVPGEKSERYYFFAPKRMMSFYYDKNEFEKSDLWGNVRLPLDKIVKITKDSKINLVIVYAPTKAKVILPLIADTTSAEQLHYYASLKQEVEEPEVFKKNFFKNINSINTVVKEYCEGSKVGFIDLTEPLRSHAQKGDQVYFTYDQHWSPIGHKVVATTISNYLKENNF